MPPRESGGTKTKSGAKKKAEEFQAKQDSSAAEAAPSKKGGKGGKGAKGAAADDDGDPRLAAAAAKEKARLDEIERKAKLRREADEEATQIAAAASKKTKAPSKSKLPAGPGAIAAKSGKKDESDDPLGPGRVEDGTIAVTGDYDALIEGAQAVLSSDKPDAVRQQATTLVDKRPERRYHAAWEAYKERELPGMRISHPGMTQHKHIDILHKQFQKSPENPKVNALAVAYNATADDAVTALETHKSRVEENLTQK